MREGIGRVVVVGSLNLDRWARVARLPGPGETVAAGAGTGPGGKGLNQAVAAARSGASVELIGRVGDDEAGRALVEVLASVGVGVGAVSVDPDASTGLAMVWVDREGANSIVVVAGANGRLGSDVDPAGLELGPLDVVLAQGETSLELTERVFVSARSTGARTILNLAPYRRPRSELLAATSVLIVNQAEFDLAVADPVGPVASSAVADADRIGRARSLIDEGVGAVVVTLGADGAVAVGAGEVHRLDAHRVEVVDTTGAGDGFVGVLAGELARGRSLDESLRFATVAASLVVQRPGAADSMPTRAAIESAISALSP